MSPVIAKHSTNLLIENGSTLVDGVRYFPLLSWAPYKDQMREHLDDDDNYTQFSFLTRNYWKMATFKISKVLYRGEFLFSPPLSVVLEEPNAFQRVFVEQTMMTFIDSLNGKHLRFVAIFNGWFGVRDDILGLDIRGLHYWMSEDFYLTNVLRVV